MSTMYPRQHQFQQGQIFEIFGEDFGEETQDVMPTEPVFEADGTFVMEKSTVQATYARQHHFQHGQIFEVFGEESGEEMQDLMPTEPAFDASGRSVTEWPAVPATYSRQNQRQQSQAFGILVESFGGVTQNVMPTSDPAFDASANSVMENWQHQSHPAQVPDSFPTHTNYLIDSDSQQEYVLDLPDAEMKDIQGLPEQAPWEAAGLAYRPHEASILASGPPKHPSGQEWEAIKPFFKELYITENRPLKEVKEILERDHGFIATERMFKGRLAPWGLTKNLKRAEKAARLRVVRETRHRGQLFHHGRDIEHRLRRFLKETKASSGTPRTTARQNRDRLAPSTATLNDHAEPVNLMLQPLARSESHPSPSIVLQTGMRAAEEMVWNVKVYMNSYFTTGLGTWYYKATPNDATHNGLPSQNLALIKNDEAWRDVVEPSSLSDHIADALWSLESGLTKQAFSNLERANNLVGVVITQENPYLLTTLLGILMAGTMHGSSFARKICDFITGMAATILDKAHPITKILNQMCQLSSATSSERCHAWRAVNDALDESLECLEDPALMTLHLIFLNELTGMGFWGEAEGYLGSIFSENGKIEEESLSYRRQKADLLRRQHKYLDAELLYRECLESREEEECHILAGGATSDSWEWHFDISGCLYFLGETLESAGRIEEAKTIFRRMIKFDHAAFGPESAESQSDAAAFDDFLTENGFVEEREAFRAQYPCLLERQLIPKELL